MVFFHLTFLPKQKGGRLDSVSTFRTYCRDKIETSSQPTAWIKVRKTIKLPESEDLFGHVALAHVKNLSEDVVVKVYERTDMMLQKEKTILTVLNKHGLENVIRLICSFDCDKEDKLVWYDKILKKRVLCGNTGKDKLSFLVMEYIPYGNITDFMSNNAMTTRNFKSFVKQACLFLLEIHYRFKIHHGDIHGGNLLIDICDESKICSYRISKKIFQVKTHGVMPIFIDFGRASRSSSSKSSTSSSSGSSSDCSIKEFDNICWCMQEILVLLQMFRGLTSDKNMKKWVKTLYEDVSKYDKTQTLDCAERIFSA